MNMKKQHTPTEGGRVPLVELVITGDLDASAAPRLGALLDEALQLRPLQLVIDLADCAFIDAATIGLLLEAHRRVRRTGGLLTLRSPSPRLRRNLQLARADQVLDVMPTATPRPETPRPETPRPEIGQP